MTYFILCSELLNVCKIVLILLLLFYKMDKLYELMESFYDSCMVFFRFFSKTISMLSMLYPNCGTSILSLILPCFFIKRIFFPHAMAYQKFHVLLSCVYSLTLHYRMINHSPFLYIKIFDY